MMLKKVPHTYVIIFVIIIIAAMATWVIPGGTYEKNINGAGQTELTFHRSQSHPQTWQVMTALFDGFEKGAGIIAFILIIGGTFWIINHTRAIDSGIGSFLTTISKMSRYKAIRLIGTHNLIIVMIMLLFSVFGAVFGMSEETIAFIVILVPLAISMGYDSITGVSMVFVAAGVGFAGAMLNPFTIGIAQELSGLPMFSGIEYRLVCWILITATGIGYTLWYASKIRKDPTRSPVYEEDEYWRTKTANTSEEINPIVPRNAWAVWVLLSVVLIIFAVVYRTTDLKIGNNTIGNIPLMPIIALAFIIAGYLSLRQSLHTFILTLLAFTIIVLITGVMGYQWYIAEIAGLFLTLGLAAGFANGESANDVTRLFIEGAKDILSAAMVVGLAAGIIIILENGQVIHAILYYMADGMREFGKIASIGIMYMIQTTINIFIPSGSAKAALTIPIMAPFGDLIGISRQATVMAFQFGDGFTNMITPTSGVLIGVLGMARIPYSKWVKWVFPLIIFLTILGFILLIPTVIFELNGF